MGHAGLVPNPPMGTSVVLPCPLVRTLPHLGFSLRQQNLFRFAQKLRGKSSLWRNIKRNGYSSLFRKVSAWDRSKALHQGFGEEDGAWPAARAKSFRPSLRRWTCSFCPAPYLLSPWKSDYWSRPAVRAAKQLHCFSSTAARRVLRAEVYGKTEF